ncbi:EamA family transporter [Megalodesulfovibrio paquesii]
MLWFFLALATAVSSAVEVALAKRWYGELDPLEMLGVQLLWSLPALLLGLVLVEVPEIKPGFWWQFALLVPVNVLASLWVFAAVKEAPLSLTMPLQSFTPLVMLLPAWLLLDEAPSWAGLGGIVLVVLGSYVLNVDALRGGGIWGPFRAIIREPGARHMLGAAALFGLSAVQGKDLALKSSVLWSAVAFFTVNHLVVLGIVAVKRPGGLRRMLVRAKPGSIVAGIWIVHILSHYTAIMLVDAAYMVAIKRLNGLVGVLLGGMLFREDKIRQRLLGAACMSAGAAVLALWA